MKTYPTYKATNIPWLPSVPEHWITQRAKYMYNKENRPVREQDETITCFRDGTVTLRKNRRTTGFTESIQENGYQGVRKGDLVIHVMDAFAGSTGVSDSDGKATPVYSVCTALGDFNNYFYAHILRVMAKTGFIQSLYRGIRERSSDFRFEVFANQILPIPPREEQDQIVKYLDWQVSKINHLIKTKREEITTLKELKQNIISNAVSKGINQDVQLKESGLLWLGKIPKDWKTIKIKRTSWLKGRIGWDGLTSAEYQETGPYLITGVDFDNGTINWDTCVHISKERFSEDELLHVKEGDLLITKDGTIGKVAIVRNCPSEVSLNSGVMIIRNTTQYKYVEKYLYYVILSDQFSKWYELSQVGNTTIKHLYQEQFYNFEFSYPDLETQHKISEYLDEKCAKIDAVINNKLVEINFALELKTRLISDVVTGQLDVRNIEIPEYEYFEDSGAEEPEENSEEITEEEE